MVLICHLNLSYCLFNNDILWWWKYQFDISSYQSCLLGGVEGLFGLASFGELTWWIMLKVIWIFCHSKFAHLMMYKVILMVLNTKLGYWMMLQGLLELSSCEVCVLNDFENLWFFILVLNLTMQWCRWPFLIFCLWCFCYWMSLKIVWSCFLFKFSNPNDADHLLDGASCGFFYQAMM